MPSARIFLDSGLRRNDEPGMDQRFSWFIEGKVEPGLVYIKHLRLTYSPEEDRVSLTGEDAKGASVRLWLTARLLNRLVPQCVQCLEQQGRRNRPRAIHEPSGGAAAPSARQADGERKQPAAEKVPLPATPAVHLVAAVVLQATEDTVRLIFGNGAAQDVATLILTRLELSQWLSLLHQAYLSAAWPLANWPAWVSNQGEPNRDAHPPTKVVFH